MWAARSHLYFSTANLSSLIVSFLSAYAFILARMFYLCHKLLSPFQSIAHIYPLPPVIARRVSTEAISLRLLFPCQQIHHIDITSLTVIK